MPVTTRSTTLTKVIKHIVDVCSFRNDSTMMEIILQQGWSDLTDVITLSLEDVGDLTLLKDDGSYSAKPLAIHVRKLKGFLLLYNRKCTDLSCTLDEDDVLDMTKTQFVSYCGSPEYHADIAEGLVPAATSTVVPGEFTASEFRRVVKRDKTHYSELKDDKHFNMWNRGFVATAYMHHTQLILDADYKPATTTEVGLFREMQDFMYAVFEEKLKTDKGKSLISAYENTRDAQSIYRELTKHAKSSTAAQLSGDTLLKYITSARYPGNWRGTSYAFVLHWKEQVMHYEKLELEDVPPKQKLRMLQNTVGDVADLANVKQLSDQVVARGGAVLGYEAYMELLLSACSTYDRTHATPRSGQRNVYHTTIEQDDEFCADQGGYAFGVDTEVTDILAYATDMHFQGAATIRNDKSPLFQGKNG